MPTDDGPVPPLQRVGSVLVDPEAVQAIEVATWPSAGSRLYLACGAALLVVGLTPEEVATALELDVPP